MMLEVRNITSFIYIYIYNSIFKTCGEGDLKQPGNVIGVQGSQRIDKYN